MVFFLGKEKPERQYVRTLTLGWRFTLPSRIRKARNWKDGTLLEAEVLDDSMILKGLGDGPGHGSGLEGGPKVSCYLGSGGKMVVPSGVRELVPWRIGERLAIKEEFHGVVVTPCCQKGRCRSCGELYGVSEVIDNLFLCSKCWNSYREKVRA